MTETILDVFSRYQNTSLDFPEFPKDRLEWTTLIINNMVDTDFSYIPYQYWLEIINSKAHRIFIEFARQLFKTTFFGFASAHLSTTKRRSTTIYIAPDEDKLSTFADQKYRAEILQASPLLRSCIFGNKNGLPGRRTKITWNNGSFNWNVTDEGGYRKVEGKSPDLTIYDEIQLHDLVAKDKAKESQSKKMGKEYYGGIGGEYGSLQEALWNETTQAEWHYNNEEDYIDSAGKVFKGQGWRTKLEFGLHENIEGEPEEGLIYAAYMAENNTGFWDHLAPENEGFPGYHLSQTSACHVPLSQADAINLYKVPIDKSIEYKELNYPRLMTLAHVHAVFYKAPRKPITRADALATLQPYRYLSFFSPNDILDFKLTFPGRIKMLMGIDWGSGNDGQGQTVITIMLKWIGIDEKGQFSPNRDRYFIAYMERLDAELSADMSEAFHALDLFRLYHCDYGAADLGFGTKQVNAILHGGYDPRTNTHMEGLGYSQFIGTWTRGKITKTEDNIPTDFDEEGSETVHHLLLDHTHVIENYIDMVKWQVPHPAYITKDKFTQQKFSRRKLAIPYADAYLTHGLIKDMTSITRSDIEKDFMTEKLVTSESPKKKYAHPADSVVSQSHCFIADGYFDNTGTFAGTYSHRTKPGNKSVGTAGIGSSQFTGSRRKFSR